MLLVKEKEKKDHRISNYFIISAIISTCDDETFIFESAGTKSSGFNHFNETFAHYFWYNPSSSILQKRKKVG